MKHILLFLVIFSHGSLFGQLSVISSDESEHFLYVENTLLYVAQDIQLTQTANSMKPTLYLRENAELIQGEASSNLNGGTGNLSIYQRGTSSAYDYNYWSLPVAVRSTASSILDYIYEPIDELNSTRASLSSGLNGVSHPLQISSSWIYAFSGSNYSNWQYLGNQFDLYPGEGFSMKGVAGLNPTQIKGNSVNPGNAQLYDFNGTPNNGLIEIPIKKDQILLIGNPYPSSLNLDQFLMDNKSLTGIAYFWDSKADVNSHYLSDYVGGYGTYSPGLRQYAPPIVQNLTGYQLFKGSDMQRSPSPVAQGFMVIGRYDGVVRFENKYRVYANENTPTQFKSTQQNAGAMTLKTMFNSTYEKNLILGFNDASTTLIDHAMDAESMEFKPNDIFWNIGERRFVINVQPKVDEELIPLQLQLERDSQVTFSIEKLDHFDPDRIFIYDSLDKLYFGIRSGSVSLNLPAGIYKDRFYVSFIEKLPAEQQEITNDATPTSLDKPDITNNTENPEDPGTNLPLIEDIKTFDDKPTRVLLNSVEIFQNNKHQQLEIKLYYQSWIAQVSVFDLQGKQVFKHTILQKEKEFIYPTANLSKGIYIVRVKTKDEIEISKKIKVSN